MTVYVITIDDVYDYEYNSQTPRIYKNREDAQAEFDAIVADAKKEYAGSDWLEEQGEGYYQTWPDGCYSESHFCVSLTETEVR